MSLDKKQKLIAKHVSGIMKVLEIPLTPSTQDTPNRVAKMYLREVFNSLHQPPPDITTFPNEGYDQLLLEKDITIYSYCEHHLVPIHGKCHIAYIPKDKVVGLSKLIRVAQYYSSRPQLQERLTHDIAKHLQEALATQDVAVVMDLKHFCCTMRGAKDPNSSTITSYLGGVFKEQEVRQELFNLIK